MATISQVNRTTDPEATYKDVIGALVTVFSANPAFTARYGSDQLAYENFIVDLLMAGQEYETQAKLPSGTYSLSVSAEGTLRGYVSGLMPPASTRMIGYFG